MTLNLPSYNTPEEVYADLLLANQVRHERSTAAITAIEQRLGVCTKAGKGRRVLSDIGRASLQKAGKEHRISAEGRARIAAAQRKRWAKEKASAVGG